MRKMLQKIRKKFAENRREFLVYAFLAAATLFFCWLFCLRLGVFGAKVDWISQHSVFPDYFRKQFYETGELFPEFARNLGAGQNIYNFSYYGLLSPLILPSYLLPFVKMADYLMAVQILCLIASVLLMYAWLRRRGISLRISLGCSLIFLLAGPLIFHSYNQIMFVNYMPFLLLAFWGTERYFKGKRALLCFAKHTTKRSSGPFLVSVFLMVMTSFYFSIGGLLAVVMYGIYLYFQQKKEQGELVTRKGFLRDGIRFLCPIFNGILLSGILLVPTALALAGRAGNSGSVQNTAENVKNLAELFLPKVSASELFYSPYGIGLTSLAFSAVLFFVFSRKSAEKVLARELLVVLLFPIFLCLLNGGLYLREKAMIPMLPLCCYLLACYLKKLEEQTWNRKTALLYGLPYLLTLACIFLEERSDNLGKYRELLIWEGILALVLYLAAQKRRRAEYLLVSSVAFLTASGVMVHKVSDRMMDQAYYRNVTDPGGEELLEEAEEKDDTDASENGLYRTARIGNETENAANLNRIGNMGENITSIYSSCYNAAYQIFREKTFQLEQPFRNELMQSVSRNPVFQRFMGEKYVVSKETLPGIQLYQEAGKWKVYVNTEAAPVIYGTSKLISSKDYETLPFPYNQTALLAAAVADTDKKAASDSSANRINLSDLKQQLEQQVTPEALTLPASIQSKKKQIMQVSLSTPAKAGEVLFLRFHVDNRKLSKDVAVWVEGIRNKLSAKDHVYYNGNTEFVFVTALEEGQKQIQITFGAGDYEISRTEAYRGNLPGVSEETGNSLYEAIFREDQTDAEQVKQTKRIKRVKNNRITGQIEMPRNGYLITSIPYEKGFTVKVDGKAVQTEKVNTAFLGCQLEAGAHKIEILYHAPGMKTGKALSVAGILWMIAGVAAERKKKYFT